MLAPHLYPIELLRVVAELRLNFLHGLADMCVSQEVVKTFFIIRGKAVRQKRICAITFRFLAMILILILRFAIKFDAAFAAVG